MECIVEELPFVGSREHFWGAVQIYTEKSHVLNRKVCGSTNLEIGICTESHKDDVAAKIIYNISRSVERQYATLRERYNDSESTCIYNPSNTACQESNATSDQELQQREIVRTALQEMDFRFNVENVEEDCFQFEAVHEEKGTTDELQSKSKETTLSQGNILKIPWQQLVQQKKQLLLVVIRKIHPKQLHRYSPQLEVVLLDCWKTSITYITRLFTEGEVSALPRINYSFRVTGSGIAFSVFRDADSDVNESDGNITWLKTNVLPKVVKWASEIQEAGVKPEQGSLCLIDVQEYNHLYQKLKVKYGQPLVEKWPETTDPQKFVFEDVAIATYLILLWRKEREDKGLSSYQTFVDLGCGNGLLVYILSGEGHKGLGVDLRRRSIWDTFPDDVILQEGVIEPSDKHLLPEYDWLIGNHSDELTPWLPVIAAKSKYTSRFFVIPCCAHDFDCKYKRRQSGISQYADYIKYIKEVGGVCGFQMWEDRLRIPSTKRVCLIGQERTYSVEKTSEMLKAIDDFIQQRNEFNAREVVGENDGRSSKLSTDTEPTGERTGVSLWSTNFKAREQVQPVRNCTKLNEDVKHDLIATVVGILLEKKHIVEVDIGYSQQPVSWDRGGSINLADLAKRIGHQQLSALKKECGGLQTLLRNHPHMFSIMQGGVSLKVPVPEWKIKVPKDRIKTKLCWFHLHHYQSCPLPKSSCVYAHGNDDIRRSNI